MRLAACSATRASCTQCTALDFALQQCAPNAQMGLIVIRADYEGEANKLLGTAPIYSLEAGAEEAARFAFYVPIINIPIAMPVTVRSADYGLRFTVSGITQEVPLTEANITLWGFPAASGEEPGAHDSQRFAKGSPGHPAGCVGESWEAEPLCPAHANEKNGFSGGIAAGLPNQPFLGNPSVCGQSTGNRPRRRDLPAARGAGPRRLLLSRNHQLRAAGLPARRPGAADHRGGGLGVGLQPPVHDPAGDRPRAPRPRPCGPRSCPFPKG